MVTIFFEKEIYHLTPDTLQAITHCLIYCFFKKLVEKVICQHLVPWKPYGQVECLERTAVKRKQLDT